MRQGFAFTDVCQYVKEAFIYRLVRVRVMQGATDSAGFVGRIVPEHRSIDGPAMRTSWYLAWVFKESATTEVCRSRKCEGHSGADGRYRVGVTTVAFYHSSSIGVPQGRCPLHFLARLLTSSPGSATKSLSLLRCNARQPVTCMGAGRRPHSAALNQFKHGNYYTAFAELTSTSYLTASPMSRNQASFFSSTFVCSLTSCPCAELCLSHLSVPLVIVKAAEWEACSSVRMRNYLMTRRCIAAFPLLLWGGRTVRQHGSSM